MSSTRHKTEDATPMRQERYASSQEFERGLIASMVARRCSVLDDAADRELIWWIHFMSHQERGLRWLSADLLSKYVERLGTAGMVRLRTRSGSYTAEQVREIRSDLPLKLRSKFLLRGEAADYRGRIGSVRSLATYAEIVSGEDLEDKEAKANGLPIGYAVDEFAKLCSTAALSRIEHNATEKTDCLEDHLRRLCLDPELDLSRGGPWYFEQLVPSLREYMRSWIADLEEVTVVTTLGQKVYDVLDYTAHSRSMTLVEGAARTGKSFSAKSWCDQHAGRARFVEVPTGNAEKDFYLAIARGLGLGNFTQYKAGEIRERVESVLLTGNLLLCLDEAHRLWPEVNPRYGFPKRINWLMSMANQRVPICLVGTPQFIERQKAVEQSGWNSAQFIGRLGHYEPLPRELSLEDLMAVAKSVLPEADSATKRALAAYARTSKKHLAAIEAIAKRARYIATKSGRDSATTDDVRRAMKESVIPADSKLVNALKTNTPAPAADRIQAAPSREIAPPEADRNRLLELAAQQ